MHVVLGATGHIGSVLTSRLLAAREPVTAVTRDADKALELESRGACAAVLDVRDTAKLRALLGPGVRFYLLVPQAEPSTDTVVEEQAALRSILAALRGSGVERVVAESTYGAQHAPGAGDLGLLHEMEQGLKELPSPVSIVRGAYYLSNWDGALRSAREEGVVDSFFPEDFELPMVAPADIAPLVHRLLTATPPEPGMRWIEGPEAYTPRDVADAFGAALGKRVAVRVVPRAAWRQTFESLGFSAVAAESFTRMLGLTLDQGPERPAQPERGATSLPAYVEGLVRREP